MKVHEHVHVHVQCMCVCVCDYVLCVRLEAGAASDTQLVETALKSQKNAK